MKNFKKPLSLTLALAMSAAVMPTAVLADEAESIIMSPVDMSAYYNEGNVYRSAEDGGGNAAYAGSFAYEDFKGTHDDWSWDSAWLEGQTTNTLTTLAGTKFELKVVDGKDDTNTKVAFSNYGTRMNSGYGAWTTIDIEDGYYKTVELLSNDNSYSSGSSREQKIAVRLDYYDGSSEIVVQNLNYFTNAYSSDGVAVNGKVSGISSRKDKGAADVNGYVTQYSIDADETKALASVSILNDEWYLDEDNNAKSYKDLEGWSYAGNNWTYTTQKEVTDEDGDVVTDDDGNAKTQTVTTTLSNANHRVQYRVYACLVYAMTLTTTETLHEKSEELVLKDVNVDMSNTFNRWSAYIDCDQDGEVKPTSVGYWGAFDYAEFKNPTITSEHKIKWKNAWTDDMTWNVLELEGHTFDMKVVNGNENQAQTSERVVFANQYDKDGTSAASAWTNIAVDKEYYDKLYILANNNRKNTTTLVVRLNYADGTSEVSGVNGEYKLNALTNTPGVTYVESWNSKHSATGKIGMHTVKVNSGKTLESIDVLSDKYVYDAETGTARAATAGETELHSAAIYAMTLTTSDYLKNNRIDNELAAKINAIPELSELTYSDKAQVEAVGKAIEEYEADGRTLSEDLRAIYTAAVERIAELTPVYVYVDMTDNFDLNNIYRNDGKGDTGDVMYAGAFDYDTFKGAHDGWSWDSAWEEGQTANTLTTPAGTKFKMKVDLHTDSQSSSYVAFSNYKNRLNRIGKQNTQWIAFDFDDGLYDTIELLADTNANGGGKKLLIRLDYADGTSEIVKKNVNYPSNGYSTDGVQVDGAASGISSNIANQNKTMAYITQYSIPVNTEKKLSGVSVLNSLYTINDEGDVVEDTSNTTDSDITRWNQYLEYTSVIYAMTLTSTKERMKEQNADYVAEIIAKIDSLEGSAADKDTMDEIADMLSKAWDKGITETDITNLSKYTSELAYFVSVTATKTENDEKTATVTFTFDKDLTDELVNASTFTVSKDGGTAEAINGTRVSSNMLSVTFAHGMDYDHEWCVSGTVGFASFNRAAELTAPIGITNVSFTEGESALYNFYKAETGFTVTADVTGTDSGAAVLVALYDGERLVSVKTAAISDNVLTADFTASGMDESWDLKAFVWDSRDGMKPYEYAKSLKKTYGYDNLIDKTKDLTIVYFGDSQTEGKNFTTPLTEKFSSDRAEGAVTAINAGQGGTAINLGMYRLDEDVIAYDPDVVFIEFFPNDANISSKGETTEAALAKDKKLVAYHENVIKRLLALDHVPVIIYMNPMHREGYNSYAVEAISDLLEAYDIPLMNFQTEAECLIREYPDIYSWDYFTKSATDVHFTTDGGALCAAWMYGLMTDGSETDSYVKLPKLGVKQQADEAFANPHMVSSKYADCDSKWSITSLASETEGYNNPVSSDAFPGEYLAATEEGAELTFTFNGTSLYIYTLIGRYGGKATWVIDGKYMGTLDEYTNVVSTMYKCPKLVRDGLENGTHTVTFTVCAPNTNVTSEKAFFGIAKFMVEE